MSGTEIAVTNLTTDVQTTAAAVLPVPFSFAAEVVSSILLLAMMVFGIFANLITLIVILSSKRLWTVVNILIVSLSVSDLLSAIISPLNLYRRTWGFDVWNLPDVFCKIFNGVDIWTSGVTALHILTFSFVRLISMKWPHKYKTIKKLHVKIVVGGIWFITFGCGAIPGWLTYKAGIRQSFKWPACTLDPNWVAQFRIYSSITYPILVFIPMISTGLLTCVTVLIMLRRRASRIKKKKPAMFEAARKQLEDSKRRTERKENHAMLQLGLIAGSFMFGYIPITSYAFYTTSHSVTTIVEAIVDWNYGMIAYILLRISECLNPIFYNIASNKMRRETFQLLAKVCKCCTFKTCLQKTSDSQSFSETSVGSKPGTLKRRIMSKRDS